MALRRPTHHRRNPSVDMPKYAPQGQAPTLADTHYLPPSSNLAQISDYDSDNPGYISDFPAQPPPPNRTNAELNLSVLQRHNNQVTLIISVAPYAVVYEFTPLPDPAWSKTGVEGSLFICQLTPGPYGEERYAAIVLNRRGLDNFEAPLIEGENAGVEITEEYVIISFKQEYEQKIYGVFIFSGCAWTFTEDENAVDFLLIISFKQEYEQKIYGVFIFSEGPGTSTANTREDSATLMKSTAVIAGESRKAAEKAASEAQARHTNGHIQEAEEALEDSNMGAPMGRQISLQQLFGQQRAQDASFSVRSHNLDGAFDGEPHPSLGAQPSQIQQPDVIADLFRKAGIGMG